MISAIIIDDEVKNRELLTDYLNDYCPGIRVIGSAANISNGYALVQEHQPQLVFLDITMPGGDGFEFLELFEEIRFEVIFVTAHQHFALEALKLCAVDYLLKPVDISDLCQAVDKAQRAITQIAKLSQYELLRHNLQYLGSQQTKIAIPGVQHMEVLTIREIIRCEGWQKYTRIYLTDGRQIVSSYHLGLFREMLGTYGFFSVHKSHLINTHLIIRYQKDGTVVMKDHAEVPVSRRRREVFMEEVMRKMLLK